MQLPTIDQIVFKGTHNSYSCKGEGDLDPPFMDHPPNVQIDDFGVWAVELDFSVTKDNGVPRAIVGHDRPRHATCWGYYLTDFLTMISNASSLNFRPVFIYFDIHDWNDGEIGFTTEQKLQLGLSDVKQVFGVNYIVLDYYLNQPGGAQYPTVQDLVGKAVIYFPAPEFAKTAPPRHGTLRGTWTDHCTSARAVANSISTGAAADDTGNSCGPQGCRVMRLDQYQADWTFEYGVPPNPLVVDVTVAPPWTVTDSTGDHWSCGNDVWRGQVVSEQGTYRFPYKTVEGAVSRASGTTSIGSLDPMKAGYGWTILIRPGNYRESLIIDIPLTLKKDDQLPGSVLIG